MKESEEGIAYYNNSPSPTFCTLRNSQIIACFPKCNYFGFLRITFKINNMVRINPTSILWKNYMKDIYITP